MGHVSIEYRVEGDRFGDHCTVLYLGETDAEGLVQRHTLGQLYRCLVETNYAQCSQAKVSGLGFFGPHDDIPVIVLEPNPELLTNREIVESCLASIGIVNGSQYSEYNPHVTIKFDNNINPKNFPSTVHFNGLYLSWNNAGYRID